MEKFKSQLVLTSVKKYYKKEEPSKISGLGLKFLDFKTDQMNPKTVLASLWLFDQTNWSIYLRHKNIYDDVVGQADDRGYYELKTQHPVLLTYHLNDKNYKDIDEIEFLNVKPEQTQFTGFTDEDVAEVTKKAKEEVAKEKEDAKNFAPETKPPEKKPEFTQAKIMTLLNSDLSDYIELRDLMIIRQSCIKAAADSHLAENIDDLIIIAEKLIEWVVRGG